MKIEKIRELILLTCTLACAGAWAWVFFCGGEDLIIAAAYGWLIGVVGLVTPALLLRARRPRLLLLALALLLSIFVGLSGDAKAAPPGVEAKEAPPGVEAKVLLGLGVEELRLVELWRELGSPSWFLGYVESFHEEAGAPIVGTRGEFLLPRWWVQEVSRRALWAVMAHEISHLLDGRHREALQRRAEALSVWGWLGARERSEASMQAELACDLDGLWVYIENMGEEYYLPHLWLGIDEIPLIDQGRFPSHPPRQLRWQALAAILY